MCFKKDIFANQPCKVYDVEAFHRMADLYSYAALTQTLLSQIF